MTMKSLLLGAAAGLVTVGAAQAADLPMTKADPVEYVKVCTEFGTGFFYIPGTDTCLRIGGEVRADYGYARPDHMTRYDDGTEFRTRAQLTWDARTNTEYGLLRSFVAVNAKVEANGRGNWLEVDKAYIQFGGLTAGYAHSFWGFYDSEYGNTIWGPYYTYSDTTNLLAYSFAFGGGVTATLSLEDPKHTRTSAVGWNGAAGVLAAPAGTRMPDVLGQIRIDQSWGKAAVQGVFHQAHSGNIVGLNNGIGGANALDDKNKYGWAVGGSLALNLPIAAGGHFVVEGQYARGATAYLGAPGVEVTGDWGYGDGYIDNAGSFKLSKGWSVVAELGVDITPNLSANLVGSYVKVDNLVWEDTDLRRWTVTGNVWYTITTGLSVGAEVSYINNRIDYIDAAGAKVRGKDDGWQGVVRIKRTF